MENNIILKIGTVFNGEGMQKLANATQGVNSQIKQSSIVATKLSSAFGQLDTAGSKCMTAVTGLIGAFTQGGVQGAIFAGVIMSINAYFDKQKQKAEELKQRVKEMGDQIMATFSTTLNDQVNAVTSEISNITKSFDNATAAAKAFSGAVNNLSNSQSAGGIIALEIAKFQAVLDATSEAEAKHAEAAYDLQIQEEKNAQANSAASDKLYAATEALSASRERETLLAKNRAKVEEELAHLEETLKTTTETQKDVRKQLNAKITELSGTLDKLDDEIIAQQNTTKRLVVEEQTARQNQINVENDGVLAITKLNAAKNKELLATEAATKKKEEELLEKEQEKLVQQDYNDAVKHRTDLMSALAQAENDLKTAEAKLATAIENYEKNIVNNKIAAAIGSNDNGKGVANARAGINKAWNDVQDAAAKQAAKEGLANGSIRTVDDYIKAEKAAKRAAREEMSSEETNRMASEKYTADRIRAKSEKARSDAEKEWLKKYDEVEKANNKDADAITQAEMDVQAAKENMDRIITATEGANTKIGKIQEQLHALGLK